MSIVTRTYTFTDGTTAYGSQVESEIQNLTTVLNNLDAGSTTWTNVKVTTLSPQANVAMGGFKLTGLAAGTTNGDSVRFEQITAVTVVTGTVIAYVASAAPSGYLYCDGSAVSRATYSGLFAIASTSFGSGDGSTTFNLPDYRGRFLRGIDGGTGRDPDAASRTAMASGGNTGDSIGSVQTDGFKSHTHTANVTDPTHTHTEQTGTGGGASNAPVNSSAALAGSPNVTVTPTLAASTGITVANVATGGNETRPQNANVYWMIKT